MGRSAVRPYSRVQSGNTSGMPEDGEVVHREDRRHPRTDGARKMVQCRTSTPRPSAARGSSERVPGDVPRDGGQPAGAAPRERRTSTSAAGLERTAQPLHPAGGAGAGLDERGDVEADPHATASSKARSVDLAGLAAR